MAWFHLRPRPTRTHQPWEPTREEQPLRDPVTNNLASSGSPTTTPLQKKSPITQPVTPLKEYPSTQGAAVNAGQAPFLLQYAQQEVFADGPFMVPHDLNEINRLDFQHYALRQCMGSNYGAPLTQVRSVLDVGTGTGRWCWEIAQSFPQASIVGLDIHIPPQSVSRAANYIFVRGNILETLPFANGSFDFVHQRLILFRLPMHKLQHVFRELLRVTAHSGWIEVLEVESEFQYGGIACQRLNDWAVKISQRHGIDLYQGKRVGEFLHLLGLKNIEVHTVVLPVGRWAGRIGSLMAADMSALNRAIRHQIVTELQVSPEEYDQLSQQMQREWEEHHCNMIFHVAYGQRL